MNQRERDRREDQREESEAIKGKKRKKKGGYMATGDPTRFFRNDPNMALPALYGSVIVTTTSTGGASAWVSSSNLPGSVMSPSPSPYIYPNTTYQYPYSLQFTTSPSESPNQSRRRLPQRHLATPVVGFRSWGATLLNHKRAVLTGTGYQTPWPGGVNHAKCLATSMGLQPTGAMKRHRAPHQDCHCGIYAFNEPDQAGKTGGSVVGAIVAWGKLVEHGDEGFRAAHARVIALAVKSRGAFGDYQAWWAAKNLTEEAARCLKVPAVPFETLSQYAREFGEQLSELD